MHQMSTVSSSMYTGVTLSDERLDLSDLHKALKGDSVLYIWMYQLASKLAVCSKAFQLDMVNISMCLAGNHQRRGPLLQQQVLQAGHPGGRLLRLRQGPQGQQRYLRHCQAAGRRQ